MIMELKIRLLVTAVLLNIFGVFAQAPEKMNYQAVARDLSGNPLVSSAVNLQFDILQGSATGIIEYSETQSKTTNQFGLFTAEIGAGSVALGDFSTINWGVNAYFLRVTVNGDVMPATQLLSVPYALYSKTSGGAGAGLVAGPGIDITGGVITAISDTSATNEFQTLSINATSDTLFLSDGGFVYLPASSNSAALIDGDGDTQILVDSNATDDDVIHFINAGVENIRIINGRLEFVNNGESVFIGRQAGISTTTGTDNTFIGDASGQSNTSGLFNTGVGSRTLSNLNVGSVNTAVGFRALEQNISGSNNVAVGLALPRVTTGHGNIAVGQQAGDFLISGSENIFIGEHAGSSNTIGNKNIFIGDSAGFNELGSNKLYIGTGSSAFPLIFGDLANDSLKINGSLSIVDGTQAANSVLTSDANGNATWQPMSSSLWTQGTGNDIYNNTDSVGIGTTDPKSALQIGDFMHQFPLVLSGTEEYTVSSYNSFWDGATLRNTKGGISGISIMGDDNGNPVMSWLLYPSQPAGTDMFGVNPSLRMNLRSKGLAINSDVAAAGLEVTSLDSASIFMETPDDNSQPTLSYRAPGGTSEILSLRVPNTLTNSYTLTYPIDLPTTAGSSLVSDLAGNLSWSNGASPWSKTGAVIHPSVLTENVGIGSNSAAYPLEIKKNQTGTAPFLGIVNTNATGDAPILMTTAGGAFMMGVDGNSFKIASSNTNLALNTRMMIGSTGNVGFGTTAPTAKVHTRSVGNATALNVVAAGATTSPAMTVTSMAGSPAAVFGNGFVGIGTWSPSAPLHTSGAYQIAARLESSSNIGTWLEMRNSSAGGQVFSIINTGSANGEGVGKLLFNKNTAFGATSGNLMTLEHTTSHVGIGTTSPSARFHLNGSLRLENLGGTAPAAGAVLTAVDANGNAQWQTAAAASPWTLSGTNIFPSTLTNNVGIGTNAPHAPLQFQTVNVNRKIVLFEGADNDHQFFGFGTNPGELRYQVNAPASHVFYTSTSPTSSAELMRIVGGSGNVGIGTNNPQNKLDVEGAVAIGANYSGTTTAPANSIIVERNVGIGSTSPGMIAGSTNYLTIASTGAYASGSVASLELKGNTNSSNDVAAKIDFLNGLGTNNTARIENITSATSTAEGQLLFYTKAATLTERMRINEDGDVGIGTNSPSTSLDVAKDVAIRENVVTLSINAISNMSGLDDKSFVNFDSAPSDFTIYGIANGVDGKILRLYNSTTYNMTLANETTFNTAANRILTMSGGNISTVGDGVITLQYSGSEQRWIVVSIVQ